MAAILWAHAVAGAGWVGSCACFVIAGMALSAGSVEQRNFVTRAAPKIERLGLAAAVILFATGLANLASVAVARRFEFSTQFAVVLSSKIVLFIAMTMMLGRAMRAGVAIRELIAKGRVDATAVATARMVRAHLAIATMGVAALIMGLWLMGS